MIATVVGDVQHAGSPRSSSAPRSPRSSSRSAAECAPDRRLKAVLSGVANPVAHRGRDRHAGRVRDDAGGRARGSGACGFIVYDDTADMVAVARMVSRFLYVESCGQCPACKFGTGEVTAYLEQHRARATATSATSS